MVCNIWFVIAGGNLARNCVMGDVAYVVKGFQCVVRELVVGGGPSARWLETPLEVVRG